MMADLAQERQEAADLETASPDEEELTSDIIASIERAHAYSAVARAYRKKKFFERFGL